MTASKTKACPVPAPKNSPSVVAAAFDMRAAHPDESGKAPDAEDRNRVHLSAVRELDGGESPAFFDHDSSGRFQGDEDDETEFAASYDASPRTSFGSDPIAAALLDATQERMRRIPR